MAFNGSTSMNVTEGGTVQVCVVLSDVMGGLDRSVFATLRTVEDQAGMPFDRSVDRLFDSWMDLSIIDPLDPFKSIVLLRGHLQHPR